STSPGLCLRVVTETESSTPGSAASSLRDSVVLPAPEGEDSTSMSPRRAMASLSWWPPPAVIGAFPVLHPLAELPDHELELQPAVAQLHVLRLGAQRVRFAFEFVRKEVESTADGSAIGDQPLDLRDVGREPVELLADIGFAGDQDRLLMQPIGIEAVGRIEQHRHLL